MAAPTITINAYFTLSGSSTSFIFDDPVRGVLDGATYTLGGDIATDISHYVRVSNISRGRDRVVDQFTTGTGNLVANNRDRIFDPDYTPGAYYGNLKPGKKIEVLANGIVIYTAKITDWNYDYQVSTDSTAMPTLADDLAMLASTSLSAHTGLVGQTTGDRINAILGRPEVAFGANTSIDLGTSTLQADAVAEGTNTLAYLQTIAQADMGQLFISAGGVLLFYGRNRIVSSVGAPTFADDGTGISYAGVQRAQRTELLFNRVSVTPTGMATQTVSDAASIADFNSIRSLPNIIVPLEDTTQALNLAYYLLNLYSTPQPRFAEITVLLHDQTLTDQNTILALDLGSVVRVIFTPNHVGTAIDKFCMVEGIDHQLEPGYHTVTLKLSNLADGFSGRPFIFDDPVYGVLDGVGVLAF